MAPPYGAPPVAPAPAPASAAACAALAECGACTGQPACRWCTEPRGCVPAGSACQGFSLAMASTCNNDLVERARLDREEAEVRNAWYTRGMTPEGPPIVGRLESFPGVAFPIARGRCCQVIVRLAPGARLVGATEEREMHTMNEITNGGSVTQPSGPNAPVGVSCPRSPGKLSLWYAERWTRAKTARAGQGEVTVQLYSMPISEADLRAGDAKAAEIDRRIDRMPAGCDDCDFDCRSAGTACERRCFVDFAGRPGADRSGCEYNCQQITRACQAGCEARCR